MDEQKPLEIIRSAIKAAGGFAAVGRKFGINRASVHGWVEGGVPEEKAPELADLAVKGGLDVTCEHLCPNFPWRQACAQIKAYARRHGSNGNGTPKPAKVEG